MGFATRLPSDRYREILGACLLAFTAFLFFALVSDGYHGDVQRPIDDATEVYNLFGAPGAAVAYVLYVLLGFASHIFYFLTCVWALMLFRHSPLDRMPLRIVGMLLLAGSVSGLLHIDLSSPDLELPGGMFGAFASNLLIPVFGMIGAHVITLTTAVIGLLLSTEFLFIRALAGLHKLGVHALRACWSFHSLLRSARARRQEIRQTTRKPIQKTSLAILSNRRGAKTTQEETRPAEAISTPFAPVPEPVPVMDALPEPEDLSRIRVRQTPVQEFIPFDVVPSEEEEKISQPAETSADDTSAVFPIRPRQATPAASAPSKGRTARKKPTPRRKNFEEDELPADYVYPRRYTKPSLDLLEYPPESPDDEDLADKLRQTGLLVEKALSTHGIEAKVTDVTRGPTITRFELEPAPGIKVSKFTSLADDLALALKAHGVRVEAPIPGKGRIGIELPNVECEAVVLRELLETPAFKRQKGKLVLPLGKDISGEVVTADLASMPHLLIAGATGSGKTVCTKALLASLLFTKTPEQLQLVLVDPKMVEFSIFNDIPHLITPVVVDAKKAATALNWLVSEMEERYRLFAQLRVRNIEVYNESVENGEIEMPDTETGSGESVDVIRKLPYIVCVIDELADLMMLARAEVEDAIMRLAQLARAVGIHLILATQRPSVNVLTGVIKANFPVRIAFQVSSKVDSRCILDSMGAERLIGRGDMLYLPAGKASPTRIQGAFVSDQEMSALISYLKTQAPPQYRDEIANFGKGGEATEDLADETDELLDEAVRVVLETGQASISMVQRRLRVGYTRAARLIDIMELKGIVGPHVGSKAREILIAPQQRTGAA